MSDLRNIHIPLELWGAFFCVVTTFCILSNKNADKNIRKAIGGLQVANVILLVADTLAWYFRGTSSTFGYVMVRVSNYIVFLMTYVMLAFLAMYLCLRVPAKQRARARVGLWMICGICIIYAICLTLSQFFHWFYYFDSNNYYHRNSGYVWSVALGLVGMLILLVMLIVYRRSFSKYIGGAMLLYVLMPLIASVVQLMFYGISILNIGITMANLLIFMTFEIEQSREMIRLEQEVADMRVEMLLSQIKPHFIFNVLSTIKYLCMEKNMEEAEAAVDELSIYLRQNVDSMNGRNLVPVEEEIKRVKNYIQLEQRRFEDQISVSYDLQEEGFMIPSFTLQPLVENAIKHGITKQRNGGHIQIITGKTEQEYYVCVEDDGVGYDPEQVVNDGQKHIGIDNVRKRLQSLCGGTLDIYSQPGKGCKVQIQIKNRMDAG